MAMLHIHAIMLMHRGMGHRKLCAGSIIAQSRFTADNFAKRRLGPRLGALSVVGRKAGSTLRSSRAVPHPSTNRALRRLTSEVGRDPVYSTRYGRQRASYFRRPCTMSNSIVVHGCLPYRGYHLCRAHQAKLAHFERKWPLKDEGQIDCNGTMGMRRIIWSNLQQLFVHWL